MKEAISWTACKRIDYAKVSLESIFAAKDDSIDFYAYVDNSLDGKSDQIVELLKQYPVTKITHRPTNFMITKNAFLGWAELYELGYDIFHCFEEDLIISKDYFTKTRETLSNDTIQLSFSMLMFDYYSDNITNGVFCPWGVAYKKSFYELIQPHILPFIAARDLGCAEAIAYQKEHFNEGHQCEGDGLLNQLCRFYGVIGKYPDRSYSKDIGAYGYHRLVGDEPIKTLEEWANEPLSDVPGYGVQGANFKL